ncbi:ROK family protein [Rugosimonospora acidiphila]|uniref:ROK family protein n=1 Tax=Rugosimonospora acidiphila TaxID=556531 RepID=A0ABP9SHU4_9ACTN
MDGPARQRSLWQHNLAVVLDEVRAATPTSRARISQHTGLTRATVSALVDALVRARLVDEVGPAPRGGAGRPATGLVLSPSGPAGLGLEINVDYLAAAVVDLTGQVRHLEVRQVDQRGRAPAEVLADVADLAAGARRVAGLPLAGARLAVPGLVDAPGLVRLAPNLGWRDLDVLGPLTAAPDWPDLPVGIDNEANLAALGELATAGRERSFLYVSGEVGVGAGIVLDGALLRGTHGWSGEIGHVTVAADGPVCRCGARGCLEQYAGQEAILRAAGVPAGEALPADLAVRRLAELAGADDPAAIGALSAAGRALGIVAAGVLNVLDLDAVVLGGSFAPLAGWLTGHVEREVAGRVLTAAWSPVCVRACSLGTRAAVVGAAGAVVREVLAAPSAWIDGG